MPMRLARPAAALTLALLALPRAAQAQEDMTQSAAKVLEVFQVSGLVPAALILTAAYLLLRFVSGAAARLGAQFAQHRLLTQQVSTVLRFSIYILTFVLLVRSLFRLDDKTMLAISGTIAVSVGFALKDLAASVLAGVMILFDRPFQVGDRVTFGEHYGEIVTIGLRSVRMVTLDDSMVTIPNNKFLTDVVVSGNAGALDMQIVMDFYIAPDADLGEAKRIVTEAVKTSRFVFLEKPVVVLVNDLILQGYVATRLRAKAYVLDVHYEKAFETDVTERVKVGLRAAGITPPKILHLAKDDRLAGGNPPPPTDGHAS